MMRTPLIAGAVLMVLLNACTPDKQTHTATDAKLPKVKLTVHRTELALQAVGRAARAGGPKPDAQSIYNQHLKPYRAFYGELLDNDSAATDASLAPDLIAFAADKPTLALIDSVLLKYPAGFNFDSLLTPGLQRLKHYFPDAPIPPVYTYITGYSMPGQATMDPRFLSRNHLGIGLHYWLGPAFKFYPPDIPKFVRARCTPAYMPVDVMQLYIDRLHLPLNPKTRPTLVHHLVHTGIRAYVLQQLLPHVPDSTRWAYSAAQLKFAENYLPEAYNKMIPLLHSTDYLKYRDWLVDAPYTRGLSQESPGRLGAYLGWRLVQKYMQRHPEVTLGQLVRRTDYDDIFKQSGFKP